MRIAILDDDPADLETLRRLTGSWAEDRGMKPEILLFPSAEAFRFGYGGTSGFDILLLDVEMSGEDGVTLAKQLRRGGCSAEIIFVTSHFELAGEGYDVDALHWLVKPVSQEKLSSVLTKAAERLAAAPPCAVILSDGETVRLAEADILFVEVFLHYLAVHTAGREYRVKEGLGEFSARLSADFFRVHRSVLVNLRRIVRITRKDVMLDSGDVLPIARGKYDAVNRAFIERN